jgi:hypothetical protein
MKRKLQPARTMRAEYPTLEIARRILLAGALACGVAHADNSIPQTGQGNVVRPVGTLSAPIPPQIKGGPMRVQPLPPGLPPTPTVKKVEKKK